MHTRKRHQNMLQDLNRKVHHAEKDRESPASDSKVSRQTRRLCVELIRAAIIYLLTYPRRSVFRVMLSSLCSPSDGAYPPLEATRQTTA